jgi:glyoxylase-like metal-dependent hydrolase (beta-lactamase superfamily II)
MKRDEHNPPIPMSSILNGICRVVSLDVFYFTDHIVNVIFVGVPGSEHWVLIDAGFPGSAERIMEAAEGIYGRNSKPKAIILTHGHVDHVGNVVDLAGSWKAPVYAHTLEFPFLRGEETYPDPVLTTEGGLLAKLSLIIPKRSIDISGILQPLPSDHTVPFLPEWEWIHTPGSTPGHVSFFRKSDRFLIAGDAFITVRTSSFLKGSNQKEQVNHAPRCLTADWNLAKVSIGKLAGLQPNYAIVGHGVDMWGKDLTKGLNCLIKNVNDISRPGDGKNIK